MKGSPNSRILTNSIYLYCRLIVTSIIALFVTRLVLKGLGTQDFGLYNLVGGIVIIISFVNTVMLTSSNRFIAFEIGRGESGNVKEVFNVSLLIHFAIALMSIGVAATFGEWYIKNIANIAYGMRETAILVFRFSVIGAITSFLGVPYQGLMTARENFQVFCLIDIFASIFKLIVALVITSQINNKLIVYSELMMLVTAFPTLMYFIYCKIYYPNDVKFGIFLKKDKYKEIFDFSVWIGYGALATVGKSQGAVLIINKFFGVILNAALGIANMVNSLVLMFASSVSKAISPQITKSFASGDYKRVENLIIYSSKLTFFLMLLPAVPLIIGVNYLLGLWLGTVPEYTSIFIVLLIIDALVGALNSGIPDAIFASGNIKWYQIIINTIFLLSLPLSYFILKLGGDQNSLFYSYIAISIVAFFVRQRLLRKYLKGVDSTVLFKRSYLPTLLVCLCVLPSFFLLKDFNPILAMSMSLCWVVAAIFFVGTSKREKMQIKSFLAIRFKYLMMR